jgi:excisionase family DNA binding protein
MACRSSKVEPITITPRLLCVKSAAAYLSATVWAMRKLAWNAEVPSVKIGGRLLFDRADLDSYIDRVKTA